PPTNQDAQRGQQQVAVDKLLKTIEKEELKSYQETANELLQEHDSITVISAALKMLTTERRNTPVRISSVAPITEKKAPRVNDNRRRSNNNRYYGKRNQGARGQVKGGGSNRKGNFQKRRNRDRD